MNKNYLLAYKANIVQPLNSGFWHFTLTIKKVWLWGLFSTVGDCEYQIHEYAPFETTLSHWDKLIKNQVAIK